MAVAAGAIATSAADTWATEVGSVETLVRPMRSGNRARIHVCANRTRHSGGFRWLDNDSVNAISTIGGATVGVQCLL